jgi:hypothetical protein
MFMARSALNRGTYGKDIGTGARGIRRRCTAIGGPAQRLEEREREQAISAVEKAGLLKLDIKRLATLAERIKSLGIDEVEKRLRV